ncbi:VWA domain-containing protein [Pedobacter polaris]|uniref:VWA domain-containing protein n=1 Tax=Pedobacter polaris TaxID=2571273 RepID=A0A4U1CEM3_9SPHI|nr:VWA domain-containing protein [Pedobacter polaris]TKC05512.1 VWA domain-containing protein [Pedobacter polaris]
MGNFFTATSVFTFLACLLLGCLYAWFLYGTNKNLAKNLKYCLGAFRIVVITLIAYLLFAPLVKRISYHPEKPIIVLANDNSISVAEIEPIGFNKQKYQQDLKRLVDRLSEKYEVKTYSFSDSVKSGLDFSGKGKLSNASALVDRLNDELLNRNVGAVIMASDGIFNRGGNPLYEINKIKAPIYTIAMGDTIAKRDVLIANVNYNNLVYLDNEFTLAIQIQAYESKGETIQISVAENGTKVKEQNVNIDAASFVKEVQVKLKANKIGIQKYTVSVSGLKNEITTKNNTQTIFVEVIDARQKVLLAAAAPHPDIAAFKQAIELNKHYEVTVALADELNSIDPNKYGLAILYQLPGYSNVSIPLIDKLQKTKISLFYVVGAQTSLYTLGQFQNVVSFGKSTGSLQEIFPYPEPNFTAFNLNPITLKQLDDYDPLQVLFAKMSINGNYSAVLNQRIGKVKTQTPLWFFAEDNGRKLGFLIGEGIWKWKLEEAKDEQAFPLVNELISKTVQYLAVKDDKRKFKVYSSKNTYEENENVVLNATLYNDAYEPINTPDVKVQVKNANGKIFNYTFSKFGVTYRLDIGNLPQGNYTYLASTTLGNKNYTASGAFYINALIAEYQQTTANHQLLYTIAQQTNGKMVMPANLLSIADELEKSGQVKTISYEDRKYEELISIKWLFALILVLLSTEWFLRKRNGEV